MSLDEFRKLVLVKKAILWNLTEKSSVYGNFCQQKVAGNGAPKFDIPTVLIQSLIEERFTVAEMSKIICVSEKSEN